MRKTFLEEIREITFLVEYVKYNPHHDARGRFSIAGEAHLIVARDGTRTLGPKNPNHPDNLLSPTQKIEKTMHEKFPDTYFNFEGLDPPYAQKMADHLEKLMTAYPDVKPSFIGLPKTNADLKDLSRTPYWALKDGKFYYPGKTATAYLSTQSWEANQYTAMLNPGIKKGDTMYKTALILNPELFSTEAGYKKVTAYSYKSGWHPAGVPVEDQGISVLTHEFGHAIHSHLLYGGVNKAMPGMTAIGKKDKEGEVSRMTDYWTNLHRPQEQAVSGYVRSAQKEPDGQRRGTAEAIAEAFTQMTHAPQSSWTPYTKSLHAFLGDTFSQKWLERPKKVDMSKNTPQARALKKKLDALTTRLQKSRNTQSALPPVPGGEIFLFNPKPHVETTLPYGPEGVFEEMHKNDKTNKEKN